HRCPNHADKDVKCESECAKSPLQSIANPPKQPENKYDPQRAKRLRNEDVSDQAPYFAVPDDPFRVQIQNGDVIRVKPDEDKDERIETDNDADQTGNGDKAQASLEFVQPVHVGGHVRGTCPPFKWIARSS